jgi:hypothetical protein
MLLVPSSVPVPLEVTFDAPGLFVGLTVFNMTTGSPVQVGSVLPMANVSGENTYVRNFTPSINTPYLFLKQVFTDGTYTALNTNYSSASEGAYASDMLTSLALILARVGAQNTTENNLLGYLYYKAIQFDPLGQQIAVDVVQGAGAVLNCKFLYKGSKDPLDLTGITEISTCLLNDDGTELVLSLTGGQISVYGNPILGKISITLTAAQTALLAVDDSADLQVAFTYGAGQPSVLTIPGAYNIIATDC